jgi:2-hydroxy-3-keto-5-methylthiopentenyl-1-phosphate phosphatase
MTVSRPPAPTVFLDFDGTISSRDAVDAILEAYADPSWLQVEEEWKAGRIGSRECLRAQMALVHASRREIDTLLDGIDVDPGFLTLLETCARHSVRAHIVSDGFDYCIERILQRAGPEMARLLQGVTVCASHLEPADDRVWGVNFPFFHQPCAHGCATCKPAAMRLLNAAGAPIVFVGDGLSDRYAAESADVVFAKDRLVTHCLEQDIEHVAFRDLGEVAACADAALSSGTVWVTRQRLARIRA